MSAGGRCRRTAVFALAALAFTGCPAKSKPASRAPEPGITSSASSARVEGLWKITLTVTELTGELVDRRTGDVLERKWTFTPRCARGACDLILNRQTPSGVAITTPVTFDGVSYKAGETEQRLLCSGPRPTAPNQRGAVFDQGLEIRVSIEFHVDAVTIRKGDVFAVRITGSVTTNYEPTAEAAAGGCKAFIERDALLGQPAG